MIGTYQRDIESSYKGLIWDKLNIRINNDMKVITYLIKVRIYESALT